MTIASVIAAIPIFNQVWPNDCPKAIPLDLNFLAPAGADGYTLDMTNQIQRNVISGIQACYYDNRLNNAPVDLSCPDTGMNIRFTSRFQGFRPLLFGEIPKGTFTCTGGLGIFRIILLNTPVQPIEWLAT